MLLYIAVQAGLRYVFIREKLYKSRYNLHNDRSSGAHPAGIKSPPLSSDPHWQLQSSCPLSEDVLRELAEQNPNRARHNRAPKDITEARDTICNRYYVPCRKSFHLFRQSSSCPQTEWMESLCGQGKVISCSAGRTRLKDLYLMMCKPCKYSWQRTSRQIRKKGACKGS